MSGVYSLSTPTTVEITFALQKIDQRAMKLFKLCLLLYLKN